MKLSRYVVNIAENFTDAVIVMDIVHPFKPAMTGEDTVRIPSAGPWATHDAVASAVAAEVAKIKSQPTTADAAKAKLPDVA